MGNDGSKEAQRANNDGNGRKDKSAKRDEAGGTSKSPTTETNGSGNNSAKRHTNKQPQRKQDARKLPPKDSSQFRSPFANGFVTY